MYVCILTFAIGDSFRDIAVPEQYELSYSRRFEPVQLHHLSSCDYRWPHACFSASSTLSVILRVVKLTIRGRKVSRRCTDGDTRLDS